jgi:hypothetical protein
MTEQVLQLVYLLADRRLSQAKLGTCTGEASLARHKPEIEQVMVIDPFHRNHITSIMAKYKGPIICLSKYFRLPIMSHDW